MWFHDYFNLINIFKKYNITNNIFFFFTIISFTYLRMYNNMYIIYILLYMNATR